jgi:hypothetical protein
VRDKVSHPYIVLNSNAIYCSIIFANRTESTKIIKISFWSKLNVKTSSRRQKPDSSHTVFELIQKRDLYVVSSCILRIAPRILITFYIGGPCLYVPPVLRYL